MTTLRPLAAALALAGLVALTGVAPFCSPAQAGTMPCCADSDHCRAGMKAAGCCRVDPGRTASFPAAAPAPGPGDGQHPVKPVPVAGTAFQEAPAVALLGSSPDRPLLARHDPVPIYLLDASILR